MLRWRRKRRWERVNLFPFDALPGERADYRGIPTSVCPCGCDLFLICAVFDDDERLPGLYMVDGMCVHCGALVTVPTPLDGEMADVI